MQISKRLFGLGSTLGLLCLAATSARADNGDPARVYRQGYDLVLDEKWQEAIVVFDKLDERYPDSEWTDDAAFWRCYAGQQRGTGAAESFACYDDVLQHHPHSEWADDIQRSLVRLAGELDRDGRPEYQDKIQHYGRGEHADRTLAVLVALGDIGDERSLDVILERLDATQDEHLRARIVEILEDFDSPRALEKLQLLIRNDPAPRVRMAAIDALGDLQPQAAAPLLLQLVRDTSQPDPVRVEALEELADIGAPNFDDLLEELALGDNDALAHEAIDVIGDHREGREATVTRLVEILGKTAHAGRRAEVLDTLEDIPTDSAVAALVQVAKTDPDPRMRRIATESLGDMQTEAAREALIQLLQELDD
ncbi:MAG: HEAT repeat domain-containing protein [Acidobacteriota bacterium]